MLFALGRPVVFAGLLLAFLLAVVLRAFAVRFTARGLGLVDRRESVAPRLREDVDPFGAVAVAVGGAGWARSSTWTRCRGSAGAPGRPGLQGYPVVVPGEEPRRGRAAGVLFLPLSHPLLLLPVDLLGTVFMRLWG